MDSTWWCVLFLWLKQFSVSFLPLHLKYLFHRSGTRFIVCSFCFIFFVLLLLSLFNVLEKKRVDEHWTHNNRKKKVFRFFDSLVWTLYNNFFIRFSSSFLLFIYVFLIYTHINRTFFYNTCVHNVITVRKLFCDGTLEMKKKKKYLILFFFFAFENIRYWRNLIPNRHWQRKPNKQQILRMASKYAMKIFMIQNIEMQRTQPKNKSNRGQSCYYIFTVDPLILSLCKWYIINCIYREGVCLSYWMDMDTEHQTSTDNIDRFQNQEFHITTLKFNIAESNIQRIENAYTEC